MTDPGDEKLSRRYREAAGEEPPAALDAAILKAARERASGDSGTDPKRTVRGPSPRWMGPISIAAVLVLGIGVSLRMQMEQPGVETSAPSSSAAEYPMPAEPAAVEERPKAKDQANARQDAAPAPRPKLAAKPEPPAAAAPEPPAASAPAPAREFKELAKRSEAPAAQARRREADTNVPADAQVVIQPVPVPAAPPAPPPAAMRDAPAQAPAPAAAPARVQAAAPAAAPEAASSPPAGAIAGRTAQSAPLRAKREGYAADTVATESRRIAAVADPDPNRELERIALLREARRHAEADRALEEFRRRHSEFRIPDAVWQRVRPR